jgi:hypothetical protein
LCGCHDSSSSTSDGSVAITDTAIHDAAVAVSFATPVKKQIFLEMVSSAEQSALDWTTAYPYCEDIGMAAATRPASPASRPLATDW